MPIPGRDVVEEAIGAPCQPTGKPTPTPHSPQLRFTRIPSHGLTAQGSVSTAREAGFWVLRRARATPDVDHAGNHVLQYLVPLGFVEVGPPAPPRQRSKPMTTTPNEAAQPQQKQYASTGRLGTAMFIGQLGWAPSAQPVEHCSRHWLLK